MPWCQTLADTPTQGGLVWGILTLGGAVPFILVEVQKETPRVCLRVVQRAGSNQPPGL